MVEIDQPQTKKWLELSDAVSTDWQLNLKSQTRRQRQLSDYWREAYNLSNICE